MTWDRAECTLWNNALLDHFTSTVPVGMPFFLGVDDEVLNRIGEPLNRSAEDFVNMVRHCCVWEDQVAVPKVNKQTGGERPGYLYFLAAMVLAAHWMEKEELGEGDGTESFLIDEKNYFTRLRQVLGIDWSTEIGRPAGMRGYEEQPLWDGWNRWLAAEGWQPTAEEGEGSRRYISYPLSQTLLRDGDKKRLAGVFWTEVHDRALTKTCDAEMLLVWMKVHRSRFSLPRLWELLDRPEYHYRHEAAVAAVFDIYSSVDWDTPFGPLVDMPDVAVTRRLSAGLYREEDPFFGTVTYSIYPRQPSEWPVGPLEVMVYGRAYRLRPERQGWCLPLPAGIDPPEVQHPLPLLGNTSLRHLVLPERDFWVLISDPRSTGSTAFASWGPPLPNRDFILLCRPRFQATVDLLRQQRVLTWNGTPRSLSLGKWREYVSCRVLTTAWPDLQLPKESIMLVEALQPRGKALVHLEGGLRAPHSREGWMQHYPPEVEVLAKEGNVSLLVEDLQNHQSLSLGDWPVNHPVDLPPLHPGFYRIGGKIRIGDSGAGKELPLSFRVLQIRSWDTLDCASLEPASGTSE